MFKSVYSSLSQPNNVIQYIQTVRNYITKNNVSYSTVSLVILSFSSVACVKKRLLKSMVASTSFTSVYCQITMLKKYLIMYSTCQATSYTEKTDLDV